MPLFDYSKVYNTPNSYGRTPGLTPSGRGVKYSADESKAANILADTASSWLTGPTQWNQSQIDWANQVLPDVPATIIPKRLQSVGGANNPLSSFAMGLQKWGNPNTNAAAINMFNQRHGSALTPQQLNAPTAQPMATPQAPMAPPVNLASPSGASPYKGVIGNLASFDTQWNDQNDPGGFIRKHQAQFANQFNNLSNSSGAYGIGSDRTFSGA